MPSQKLLLIKYFEAIYVSSTGQQACSARISAHGMKGCAILISQCCDVLVKRKQSISVTKFLKNCHILRRLKIIFVCKIYSFINVCHIFYFQRLKIEKKMQFLLIFRSLIIKLWLFWTKLQLIFGKNQKVTFNKITPPHFSFLCGPQRFGYDFIFLTTVITCSISSKTFGWTVLEPGQAGCLQECHFYQL